jgi:hypothetical protein
LTISAIAGSWALLAREAIAQGSNRKPDPALRRFNFLVIGLLIGAASYAVYSGLLVNLPWDMVDHSLRPEFGRSVVPPAWFNSDGSPKVEAFLAFFGALLLLPRWWRQTEPTRKQRFSLWFAFATVLWAGLATMVFQLFPQPWGFMVGATISVAVQLASRCGVRPAT